MFKVLILKGLNVYPFDLTADFWRSFNIIIKRR
jgi:hypothetical protein